MYMNKITDPPIFSLKDPFSFTVLFYIFKLYYPRFITEQSDMHQKQHQCMYIELLDSLQKNVDEATIISREVEHRMSRRTFNIRRKFTDRKKLEKEKIGRLRTLVLRAWRVLNYA
ncbi:unnamed protein product [Amoebophrya sp. A120]|nr:unnamed protein product [Amoebophrya sp. A120]|eukprot:GSA120T00022184001.1